MLVHNGDIVFVKPVGIDERGEKVKGGGVGELYKDSHFFINTPRGLEQRIKDAVVREALIPCVVGNYLGGDGAYYTRMILPPGTAKNSGDFVEGLIVPDLKIQVPRWDKERTKIVGYVLTSEYVADWLEPDQGQKFYLDTPGLDKERINRDFMIQGLILHANKNESRRHPLVEILRISSESLVISEQNGKRLKEVSQRAHLFWWML
jgi:hypothetical protein